MNKTQQARQAAEMREKLSRDAAKIEELWRDLDLNPGEKPVYSNRYEVPAPEPRDTSKYNPSKLVDIETFIKHPHYLGLGPYPWQVLALKLFYAGSEGNNNLEFNDTKKEDTEGCSSCVWSYISDNETECADNILKDEPFQSILDPLNSRCLTCSRCPLMTRKTRIEHEITLAPDVDHEDLLKNLLTTDAEDLFQSEMDLISDIPDEAVKIQIMKKLKNRFQELVLIIGRRGTKSFLTVTIALYEIYRLLSMGHPQKKLKLPDFQEIHILNVARNENQAKDSIFTPMKNLAVSSPFFDTHVGLDNELEMKFLTDYDIAENERRAIKGRNKLGGTIIAKCGSSSAEGLVGKTCWIIILDELAAMAGDNPNSGVDKKLYNELKPSLTTFGKDGKIVCLSNPKGPFGKLFELYNTRLEEKTTLVLKLPTWHINANVDKLWLANEKKKDPIEFNMQYGAEFGSNSENPFLTPEDVDDAFNNSTVLTRSEERQQGYDYYCHVDPSNRSDYYAVAVVHGIPTGDIDVTGKKLKRFVVDHLHFWAPVQIKQPVPYIDVEKYLLELHQKFRFKQVTFDQWHSSEMVQKLVTMGVPAKINVFNKEYKDKIYISLLEAFRNHRIEFYRMSGGQVYDRAGKLVYINEISEAKDQFMFLQKKWRNGKQVIEALTGYKDDICDAVAAAIYECDSEKTAIVALPRARVAYTGKSFR